MKVSRLVATLLAVVATVLAAPAAQATTLHASASGTTMADPGHVSLYYSNATLGPLIVGPRAHAQWETYDETLPEGATLTYDVERFVVPMRSASPGAWRRVATATSATALTSYLPAASILCVRVRPTYESAAGAWASWCLERPLNDRSFTARAGRLTRVADHRYQDNRASRFRDGTRVRLGTVPSGARFGMLWTDGQQRRLGDRCRAPEANLVGGNTGLARGLGDSDQKLVYMVTERRPEGIGELRYDRTDNRKPCRVGGAVILPRWFDAWSAA